MNDVKKANTSNSKANGAKIKSSASKASSSSHINLLFNASNKETLTFSSQ